MMKEFFESHRVLLAPMAGVSDVAFRQLCIECGADLTYTEMVSAKGLSYKNYRSAQLLSLAPNEKRIAIQLFGHESDTIARQAAALESEMGEAIAYFDLNMGCPARKIAGKGDGSALMLSPTPAADIVATTVDAISKPVTVKFRRGFAMGDETAPSFARLMEAAGASAVCVHGRYAQQMYNGEADWGVIARVRESVSIPVIGNGDIRSGEDALAMIEQTGCDAVMIARAAQGNPWIFAQVKAMLEGKPGADSPAVYERIEMARRHARILAATGLRTLVRMRKHACWYVTGLPGASAAREAINRCTSLEDFEVLFDVLEERLGVAGENGLCANDSSSTFELEERMG